MRVLEFRAMNTSVMMALDGDGALDEGLRQTQAFIEDCERRLSRFLPDSELSRLNASAGEWTTVSDDLLDLLVLSRAYYDETAGLFDPSVLPDLKRAGYDVTMDEIKKQAALPGTTAPKPQRPSFASLEIDQAGSQVRLPAGMEVDLGGIAKGWIVEQAALKLRAHGTAAAVNAGGDMYFAGLPAEGSLWQVQVEDPREPTRTAVSLEVGEGAVVTSSVRKRAWKQAQESRHHIIDPRTGEPAQADWLSVTVIASHADLAEAYAKAFLIGGSREASRLMLQRPRIAVLCIDAGGQIFASSNSKEYVHDRNQLPQ
jgi:FAD:protein FMN transferase